MRGGDPAVTTYFVQTTAQDKILAYLRKNGDNEVLVLLNMSKEPVEFDIEDSNVSGNFRDVFTEEKKDVSVQRHFSFKVSDYAVLVK